MNPEYATLVAFRSGDEFPEWAKDGISNRTQVSLSFMDRIRVLFGARLEVDVFTAIENSPGRMETRGCVHVARLLPGKQIAFYAAGEANDAR